MRKTHTFALAATLLLAGSLVGCDESTGTSAAETSAGTEPDAGSSTDATARPGTDVSFTDSAPSGACEVPAPGVDSDNDGIQDVVEDRNLNCQVDPGETDPNLADSDGDGLLDGEEDLDRNGQFDELRGEFDPTVADSDGDGVLDGDEELATLCISSAAGRVIRSTAMLADGRMVLVPVDWSVSSDPENSLVWARSGDVAIAYISGEPASLWSDSPLEQLRLVLDIDDDEVVRPSLVSWGDSGRWQFEISPSLGMEIDDIARLLGVTPVESDADETEGDDGAPGRPESPDADERSLYIDISSDPTGTRVTLGIRTETIAPDGFDWATSPARISPVAGAGLRAYCAGVAPETNSLPAGIVVGDIRTGTRDTVRSVLGAISMELEANDLLSSAFFAPGDAHVTASLSAWIADAQLYSLADTLRDLVQIDSVSDDQRLWTNAISLVNTVRATDAAADTEIVLVLVSGGEDTAYRDGTFDGRDGSPEGAVIPPGPERDALDAFHATELRRTGVRLVVISPDAAHADGCFTPNSPVASPGDGASLSFQRIAKATGGIWLDSCSLPTGEGLASFIRDRMPTAYLPMGSPTLAGFLAPTGPQRLVHPAHSGLTSYAVSGTTGSDVPLVRLVWEE